MYTTPTRRTKPSLTLFTLIIAATLSVFAVGCSKNTYKKDNVGEGLNRGVSGKQEVSVNDNYSATIDYDYTKLYFEIIAIDKETQTQQTFQVNLNTTVNISDNVSFIIQGFVPDFIIADDGNIATKSDTLSNPAIKIVILRDGQPAFDSWLFQLYPDIHPFIDADYHILYADTLVEQDADEGMAIGDDVDVSEGNVSEGNVSEGNVSEGNVSEGNVSDDAY